MHISVSLALPDPRTGEGLAAPDYISVYMLFILTMYMFRKRCSKEKRQQEAQAKATKRQSQSVEDAEARRQREAQAQAAKRRSESLEDAEARRQQDSRAKAAKHQSESLEDSETRRQREARAQKRYTVQELYCVQGCLHFCIYTRLMTFCSNSGNVTLGRKK